MARRNKLMKFEEMRSFPNVYQNYDPQDPKLIGINDNEVKMVGKWTSDHFKNNWPITLELACGRGEYCLGLAEIFPERNFIGVDIKGARIWRGATDASDRGLDNVAFLRTKIEQIDLFFGKDEVDEIWITFPDPFVNKENRRLTANSFLDRYKKFLRPNGLMHLKTDSASLYTFSKQVLSKRSDIEILMDSDDIYSAPTTQELEIKTYYEKLDLQGDKKITYLKFVFI